MKRRYSFEELIKSVVKVKLVFDCFIRTLVFVGVGWSRYRECLSFLAS